MRLSIRSVSGLCAIAIAGASALPQAADAAVTEPNGQEVPVLKPTDPANYSETSIQDYFESVGEAAIDPVKAARSEPGKFSPLCNFDATLVLSQSNAAAGISWYNVDEADPTRVPTQNELFEVLKPTTTPNAAFGAASIRTDPNYAGGYVGFALTRYDNGTDKPQVPVYYSEYQRNTLCSGCSPQGHWIAALAFRSALRSDTYYLAFEDWPTYGGSQPSDWHNDGDFNDKVFKIVGISCAGGGLECSTGKLGLCGKGVTECALDGKASTCTQLYSERPEVCDSIDNDCNGHVDDGDLCPVDQTCLHGSCVFACGGLEFKCPPNLTCNDEGYCIESACVDVECNDGLACRKGICTSPCTDVVCPIGQTCVDGTCKDLCTGKVCGPDSVCQDGACVGTCGCVPCKDGKFCDQMSGACVDPGCETLSCPVGAACVQGTCVDVCANAKCPGGAACTNGTCAAPPIAAGGSAGTSTAVVIQPSTGSGTGMSAATRSTTTAANGATTSIAGAGGAMPVFPDTAAGCGCRVLPRPQRGTALLPPALIGLGLALQLGLRGKYARRRNSSTALDSRTAVMDDCHSNAEQ